MADGSSKSIEDVEIGDTVIGYDGTRNIKSVVRALYAPVRDHLYKLTFADGSELKLTKDHPLYTQEGWKSVSIENSEYVEKGMKVGELIRKIA
jgi:intein/homing endonuclease